MDLARSRIRWRRAFVVLLVVWILTLGAAAHALLDQGVTLTYQRAGYERLTHDAAVLARFTPAAAPAATRASVLATLRRQNPQAFITADDSTVEVGELRFVFGNDGRLQAIRHPALAASSDS